MTAHVNFNAYGIQVTGSICKEYEWAIPLLQASLEVESGKPVCPKFHCQGLKDKFYDIKAVNGKQQFTFVVTDSGSAFA